MCYQKQLDSIAHAHGSDIKCTLTYSGLRKNKGIVFTDKDGILINNNNYPYL